MAPRRLRLARPPRIDLGNHMPETGRGLRRLTVRVTTAAVGMVVALCFQLQTQPTATERVIEGLGITSQEAAAPELLYVASQTAAAVSVIDANQPHVTATIRLSQLGFSDNAKPHHVAVEADGSFWYVSLIGDGQVLKFDRSNQLVGQATFETPGMLAIDPIADTLYVGRSMAAVRPPRRIGVVRRSTMEIEEVDVFLPRPHAIAVVPAGGLAYTASLATNQIAAVQPQTEELEIVNVTGEPHTFVQFAISPDGRHLVTGGQLSGEILVFELTDPMHPQLTTTIPLGGEPWHPTFSPDGSNLYIPQRASDGVAVLDTRSWELRATIVGKGLAEPHGSGTSEDGQRLFIACRNTNGAYQSLNGAADEPPGTVVVIDTATLEITQIIEVPAYAAGIGTRMGR